MGFSCCKWEVPRATPQTIAYVVGLLFQPFKMLCNLVSICWDTLLADSICEVTAATSCILLEIHLPGYPVG